MSGRLRQLAVLLAIWTVPAVLGAGQLWYQIEANGGAADFLALLRFQLPSWYLWAAATPFILQLGRAWPPRPAVGAWLLPHAGAALAFSTLRTAIEVVYLLPAEGLAVTPAAVLRGTLGNLPLGLLVDTMVYGVVLAVGTMFATREAAADAGDPSPEAADPQLDDRITVKSNGRTELVDVATIDWIEAADYYACLHAGEREYLVRDSLVRLERRLAPRSFLRVHRSAIVNLRRVEAIEPVGSGDAVATLRGGTRVRVSRGHLGSLREALEGHPA